MVESTPLPLMAMLLKVHHDGVRMPPPENSLSLFIRRD